MHNTLKAYIICIGISFVSIHTVLEDYIVVAQSDMIAYDVHLFFHFIGETFGYQQNCRARCPAGILKWRRTSICAAV